MVRPIRGLSVRGQPGLDGNGDADGNLPVGADVTLCDKRHIPQCVAPMACVVNDLLEL